MVSPEMAPSTLLCLLDSDGLTVSARRLQRAMTPAIYGKFVRSHTIRTPQIVGCDKTIQVLRRVRIGGIDCLRLPRHDIEEIKRRVSDIIVVGDLTKPPPQLPPNSTTLAAELFPNQKLVLERLCSLNSGPLTTGIRAATVNVKAGQGKTFIAAGVISRLRLRTIYIVARVALAKQAIADLTISLPGATIVAWNSSAKTKLAAANADVVVVVINSAVTWTKADYAKFHLTIFDEVHMFCSVRRAEVFWRANTHVVLAMSATTAERADKFDGVYHKHYGPVLHASELADYNADEEAFTGRVKIINYFGSANYVENIVLPVTGNLFVPSMVEQFAADARRNAVIVYEIRRLWQAGHNVFVFSERRDHLDELQRLLQAADITDVFAPELNGDTATLRGGATDAQRIAAMASRIILTTYGYSSTGLSIVKMDSIVFATPRKNGLKQICARVLRKGGDASITREIVDIVDSETALRRQLSTRKQAYSFYKFSTFTIDVFSIDHAAGNPV